MVQGLIKRSARELEEACELPWSKPPELFGDISRRRPARIAYLIAIFEIARRGAGGSKFNHLAFQFVRQPPTHEISKVANRHVRQPAGSVPSRSFLIRNRATAWSEPLSTPEAQPPSPLQRSRGAPCGEAAKHSGGEAASTLQRSRQHPAAKPPSTLRRSRQHPAAKPPSTLRRSRQHPAAKPPSTLQRSREHPAAKP